MSTGPEGWEDHLDPGEVILWQGRPGAGVVLYETRPRKVIFGLAFLGFALFWTAMALRAATNMPFPMSLVMPLFGLPFIVVGARLAGGTALWRAFERRGSWYSLSSHRAFIATELLGRRNLRSWPITRDTILDLEERGDRQTVWFADPAGKPAHGGPARIGFELIENGHEVLRLMRNIQRGTT